MILKFARRASLGAEAITKGGKTIEPRDQGRCGGGGPGKLGGS